MRPLIQLTPLLAKFGGTGGALALGAMGLGFAFNVASMQPLLCAVPIAQPWLSDQCGRFGFGERPTRSERLDWGELEPGSCEALRAHIAAYPDGAYRSQAADLLAGAQIVPGGMAERERPARGYVRQSEVPFPTHAAAAADVRTRAADYVEANLCVPASASEQLVAARLEEVKPECRVDPRGGHVCAAEISAVCVTEAPAFEEVCVQSHSFQE